MKQLLLLIKKLKLEILIKQIQLDILVFKQKRTIPNLPLNKKVILHHGGGDWNFIQVNNHHKNKWGFRSSLGYYIGYQKFIEFSGKLFIGRADNEEGAHTKGYNQGTVGICLQGNTELEPPTEAQKATLKAQLDYYLSLGYTIHLHRDFANTLCPGFNAIKWLTENRYL